MASGGRPPNSAPTLPLRPSPSGPSDSLQTPDTSSLFMSSLGGSNTQSPRPSDFSSLEELLNFTGISAQVSSSSPSLPSLDTLAQDVEQKQDPSLIGPPEVKRLRCTNNSSLLSAHPLPLPPNIRVSPLSSSTTTSLSRTLSSLSRTDTIPSLLPASSPSISIVATTPPSTTHLPSVATGTPPSTTRLPSVATGTPPSTTHLPSVATGTPPSTTHLPSVATGTPPSTTHLPSVATGTPPSTTRLPSVATGTPPSTTHLPSVATHPTTHRTSVTTSMTSSTMGTALASLGVAFSASSSLPFSLNQQVKGTVSSSFPLAPPQHPISSPIVPSVLGQSNSLSQFVVSDTSSASLTPTADTFTSSAASSVFSSPLPSSENRLLTPMTTTSLSALSQGTTPQAVPTCTTSARATATTTSQSTLSSLSSNTHQLVGTLPSVSTPSTLLSRPPLGTQLSSGFSLPSHPVQRALLVQLIQAYRQCTALGDTQGQARVRAQLNVLLQAQQKLSVANSSLPHTIPNSTPSHPPTSTPSSGSQHTPLTTTQMNHIPQIKTTDILQSKPNTSLPTFSTSSPLTPLTTLTSHSPSLLSGGAKGIEPMRTVAMASNSLLSQSVAMGTCTRPSFSLGAGVSVAPSTSSLDHTISTVTPITSSHNRVPPPASPATALKAAALYNLRLKQLQLFLQSLPEEQRPRSIPELKALIQRSGGQLSGLGQPPASSVAPSSSPSAPPLPSLATTSATLSVARSIPNATSTVVPTLLPTTPSTQPVPVSLPPTTGQSTLQPTVGQCLPLLTRGFPQAFTSSTASLHAATFPSATASHQVSSTSVNNVLHTQLASVATALSATTRPPLTANDGVPSLSTGAPPLATSVPYIRPAAPPQSVAPSATTSSHNEPIKPGVPTPLPPGVNPETLAVLCRMPDAELQKLNLPVDLMTAIRVWRGQHSSASQRGRKPVGQQSSGLPVIIPPPPGAVSQSPSLLSASPHLSLQSSAGSQSSISDGFSLNTSSHVTTNCQLSIVPVSSHSAPSLAPPSLPHGYPPSRPLTRHQLRTEQTKAEKERAAALSKVLQSSEEARIAYRFNMLREKMTTQLMSPDCHAPFKSLHDVIARLLPYHMWSEAEPPPGAIEKADAVYESVAQVLMSRSQGLMSNYQHLIYHDEQRDNEAVMGVCLERFFLESEKEHKEQEIQESQQAAQIAADLSLIAGDSTLTFDADFTLGDVMNSDPMLTFEPGIT